jgi:hypothetical protein
MQRRQSKRVSANVKLVVFRRGVPVAIGRISNASNAGFFVETAFTDTAPGQELEIELPLRAGKALRNFRFFARVEHLTASGFGMSVGQSDEQARKALFVLLSNCLLEAPVEAELLSSA